MVTNRATADDDDDDDDKFNLWTKDLYCFWDVAQLNYKVLPNFQVFFKHLDLAWLVKLAVINYFGVAPLGLWRNCASSLSQSYYASRRSYKHTT